MPHPQPVALRAEIDLGAIRHNARVLVKAAGERVPLGVVKADAYGHGAAQVARVLKEEGIENLAVASVPEGIALREAGHDGPVLVFGAPLADYLPAYARHDLAVAVVSHESAEAVEAFAQTAGPLTVHVKADTGMNRLGLDPADLPAVVGRLQAQPGVTVEGVWTHLATADGDLGFARAQREIFEETLLALGDDVPPAVHVANSPSLVRALGPLKLPPGSAEWVRLGGALYGLPSSDAVEREMDAQGLRPALRLATRVVHVHPVEAGTSVSYGRTWTADRATRIGTLAAGYADGLPRGLSNAGHATIRGESVPIVGRVCMDLLMVDLGPGSSVEVGDEAVLVGPGGPSAHAQATAAGTISYSLTAGLTARVARVWHDG